MDTSERKTPTTSHRCAFSKPKPCPDETIRPLTSIDHFGTNDSKDCKAQSSILVSKTQRKCPMPKPPHAAWHHNMGRFQSFHDLPCTGQLSSPWVSLFQPYNFPARCTSCLKNIKVANDFFHLGPNLVWEKRKRKSSERNQAQSSKCNYYDYAMQLCK